MGSRKGLGHASCFEARKGLVGPWGGGSGVMRTAARLVRAERCRVANAGKDLAVVVVEGLDGRKWVVLPSADSLMGNPATWSRTGWPWLSPYRDLDLQRLHLSSSEQEGKLPPHLGTTGVFTAVRDTRHTSKASR